jgi:DHA2 family multidrug resistance protein
MALKQLMALVRQQGIVMAFADVFLLLALLFVGFAGLVVFMRPVQPPGAAQGTGH